MADEIEAVVTDPIEPVIDPIDPDPSSSTEDIDYKALAEAEKARADAAEALIVKNKNVVKRHEGDQLTEERVLELIKTAIPQQDDDAALAEAQKKVKELESKNAEIVRAVKAKATVYSDPNSAQRDGEPGTEPKLPDGSPLKDFKYLGNGIYAKKLASGKTMYKNTKATGGDRKTWTD